jgi:phosphatidate phosphatase APP1
MPYRAFGNNEYILIRGQVIEDRGLTTPEKDDNLWRNILAMIKRYSGDVIPGVTLIIEFEEKREEVTTDENGMFYTKMNIESCKIDKNGWYPVHYTLKETREEGENITAKGEAMVIVDEVHFGVISDVDDTILISNATDAIKKMRLMLFKNATTRMPFNGVSAFYRALCKEDQEDQINPLFFVSSSEWNLYDLLQDFAAYHKIPKAPFLLRNLDHAIWKFWKSGGGNHMHKYDKISRIFEIYPNMKFILIGDSGQRDPYIYLDVAKKFPGKILAVYIRQIKKQITNKLLELSEEYKSANIDLVMVEDTYQAAVHASREEYIGTREIKEILYEKEKDEAAPTEWEQLTKEKMGKSTVEEQ